MYNLKVKLARFPVRHVKKERIRDVSSFGLRNWTTWLPVTRWKRLGNRFEEAAQELDLGCVQFKGPVDNHVERAGRQVNT